MIPEQGGKLRFVPEPTDQRLNRTPVCTAGGNRAGKYAPICCQEENRPKMKEIRTGRLLLRPFKESDYDDLYEFLLQLKDDEFEGYPGITYENCREHMKYRLGSEEFYAVELLSSGKVIGNIYCGNRDFDAKEVGFIINRNYRRQGFAVEALSAVIGNTFREGTHRVFAECDPRNTGSWKLLEKAGMRREAHFRQNIYFRRDMNGIPVWKDTYVYAKVNEQE